MSGPGGYGFTGPAGEAIAYGTPEHRRHVCERIARCAGELGRLDVSRADFLAWHRERYGTTEGVSTRSIARLGHWTALRNAALLAAQAGADVSDLDWDDMPDTAPELVIESLPDEIDVASLVSQRKEAFERKRAHEEARRLIPVTVRDALPLGILFFGDPHVDDDGTDLALLERHMRLVNTTDGLWGANVGDTTNNWVGRLARLYSEQSTSAVEAWALAEWFVGGVERWLFMVGGNHDCWSGAGDPLRWIAAQSDALYQSSEVRLALRFPQGTEVRVNCRHDFKGHSQWNPSHGAMKAAQFGTKDHLLICGHKHVSGYGIVKDGHSGLVSHCVQVASYKLFDRYAREKGFRDQHVSPAVLVVIDPDADPVGLVDVYHDVERGARVLSMLRAERRRAA